MSTFEQRANMKFCFKLGKTGKQTHDMLLAVYGDECVTLRVVYKWFRRFESGQESIEDQERCGRPSTSKTADHIEAIGALVRANRRLTIREISEDSGISYGSVQSILTDDLHMRRVAAKFVPRILNSEQKDLRVLISSECFEESVSNETFLSKIITGDETWVYGYDPETKRQSSHWKSAASPRIKKARMAKSKVKVMLIVFFDCEGLVYSEFVPQGATVNGSYYTEVLRRLYQAVRRKRPEKKESGWILHHDNAPSHTSFAAQSFLTSKGIPTLSHPPYSPDLAPSDFWLFPRVKQTLKGKRFESTDEIKQKTTSCLRAIPKQDFFRCFENWQQRWSKCVCVGGDYIEEY